MVPVLMLWSHEVICRQKQPVDAKLPSLQVQTGVVPPAASSTMPILNPPLERLGREAAKKKPSRLSNLLCFKE